jgi:hypothetical protein
LGVNEGIPKLEIAQVAIRANSIFPNNIVSLFFPFDASFQRFAVSSLDQEHEGYKGF